jgi:uncharacterized protein YgiM (DUF1202 family)
MTAAEKRAKAVKIASKRVKMNDYTRGGKRIYVGGYPNAGDGVKGFSDCSSFVRWVLEPVLGFGIGANTSAQVANRARGVLIEKAAAGQTYPTEKQMAPGDCVYWKGTPSHTWGVGHVEMYLGGGKCIGHGAGTGPTIKTLKTYSKGRGGGARKYLCVIRWIPDDPAGRLGDRLLKPGDRGPMVGELQGLLKALGHDLGAYGPGKDGIDGDYGNMTRAAVRAFEGAAGISPADGVADVACIAAIKAAAGAPLGQVRVTGGTVNVRSGPGTDNRVIGVVKRGSVLELSGDDTQSWRGVLYKGQASYISARYVEAVQGE